jgi:hypothetical protein
MTLGEYRVGIPFNPLSNPIVDDIKRRAADLIDLCESMRKETGDLETDAERNRLISIALRKDQVTPKLRLTTTLLAGPRFAADVRSSGCRRRDMLAVSLSV